MPAPLAGSCFMESPAPDPIPVSDCSHAPVPRRHVMKALFASVMGGALGYSSYPWLVGNRKHELTQMLETAWERIQERASPHHARHSRRVVTPREVPLHLDAIGRQYEAFLSSLNLRHLKPREILRPHFKQRGAVVNTLPPQELWRNLDPTLRVADEIRQQLGVRLHTIASAYRCPAYNAACPGAATTSYHMRNMALDLMYDCSPAKVAEAAAHLRSTGVFKGGIGRYATFTHIDTRGVNADW